MDMRQKYPNEKIKELVASFNSGKTCKQISQDLDIPYSTVFWHVKKAGGKVYRRFVYKHPGYSEAQMDKTRTLEKTYGITLKQYNQMLADQNGVCKICLKAPSGGKTSTKSLHVDHNHTTGQIRGLLCNTCNLAVGHLQDNPVLCEQAAAYLRASNAC